MERFQAFIRYTLCEEIRGEMKVVGKEKLKLHLAVTKAEEDSEDSKIAVLLHCIEEKALEIYHNMQRVFADPDMKL